MKMCQRCMTFSVTNSKILHLNKLNINKGKNLDKAGFPS